MDKVLKIIGINFSVQNSPFLINMKFFSRSQRSLTGTDNMDRY
jgi:hypothetical protein